MKLCASVSPISRTLRPLVGLFESPFGHLPTLLQGHSSRRPLNNSFSHHPQVAQRKQLDQLRRVFDQAPIPSLAIAKLAFDHHEGVFHFGPNAGLDLLQLVYQGFYSFALLQSPSLTRHHGNLPDLGELLNSNRFAYFQVNKEFRELLQTVELTTFDGFNYLIVSRNILIKVVECLRTVSIFARLLGPGALGL